MSTIATGNDWSTKTNHLDITRLGLFDKRITIMDEKLANSSKTALLQCGLSNDDRGKCNRS